MHRAAVEAGYAPLEDYVECWRFAQSGAPTMTEPHFIRPSELRPVQEYPEWLQADAEFHARPSLAQRVFVTVAVLAIVGVVLWGLSGFAELPVAR